MFVFNPTLRSIFIAFTVLFSITAPKAHADSSNDLLMNLTIIGAIGSFGYACYEGQAPCSFDPSLNTDKLSLSVDVGADNTIQNNRFAFGADWQNRYSKRAFSDRRALGNQCELLVLHRQGRRQ